MMDLRTFIEQTVAPLLERQGVARHARVVSVNPNDHTVKVVYEEGGQPSGWLPHLTTGLGNGWGTFNLPIPGTQVFVVPDMGDMGHGVVIGSTATTSQPPPQVQAYGDSGAGEMVYAQAGEPILVGPGGAFLRLLPGGVIESRGIWNHAGDLKVSGQIRDLNGAHGTLGDLRQAYQQHKHSGVQPGGGTTGITDHTLP